MGRRAVLPREDEVRVLARPDLAETGVDRVDVCRVEAHRRRRARRARDGECSEAVHLDDRGVAEIRVHVVRGVAGVERRRLGQRGGPDEPLRSGARELDPDLHAIACDHRDERRPANPGSTDRRKFCRHHRQIQEELAVAGDEVVHLGRHEILELLSDQRSARLRAVVAFVALEEREALDLDEIERAALRERGSKARPEHVAHPCRRSTTSSPSAPYRSTFRSPRSAGTKPPGPWPHPGR